MKCDACEAILCKDHFLYSNHNCEKAYLKDVQVPVCPLCNQPIPIKRGELPDIRVGEHMDKDCQDSRATEKRQKKQDPNRCRRKGCKQRELVPLLCSECKLNFCIKHRHPSDHDCEPRGARIPAALRQQQASNSTSRNLSNKITGFFNRNLSPTSGQTVQANLSEDEALARTLQASLNSPTRSPLAPVAQTQEEEDRMLAEAIAASQREAGLAPHKEKCNVS